MDSLVDLIQNDAKVQESDIATLNDLVDNLDRSISGFLAVSGYEDLQAAVTALNEAVQA